jgi:hypothetical protein
MITFARELLCECVQEVQPLLEKHYDELTLRKDIVKLDPQWKEYALLEQLGRFVVFTARDEGRLVGYSAYFLLRHMHYAALTVAQNDVFWLDPQCRRGMSPVRFLRWCDKQLASEGVDKAIYHCKLSNQLAPILRRLGYADEEVMVGKFIGKGA